MRTTDLEGYSCTLSSFVKPGDAPFDHSVEMVDYLLFDVICQIGWQHIVVDFKLRLLA